MDLPDDLSTALDDELDGAGIRRLAHAVKDLSGRYRRADRGEPLLRTADDATAYAAFRLPATFGAVAATLAQCRARLDGFEPHSMLDVGAGLGTAAWAAAAAWPSIESVTLVERDAHMIGLGQRLCAQAGSEALRRARWVRADIAAGLPDGSYDLAVAAYSLGELGPEAFARALRSLWERTAGLLVVVEPGTPAGFARIRRARDWAIEAGAHVVAPCPHATACPMAEGDWCHFAARVARSRRHREAKGGELAYEDEKFSFISVARQAGTAIHGRIVRHPQTRPGHIRLTVCSPDGLTESVVTRSQKQRFRAARDLKWGADLPWPASHDPRGAPDA